MVARGNAFNATSLATQDQATNAVAATFAFSFTAKELGIVFQPCRSAAFCLGGLHTILHTIFMFSLFVRAPVACSKSIRAPCSPFYVKRNRERGQQLLTAQAGAAVRIVHGRVPALLSQARRKLRSVPRPTQRRASESLSASAPGKIFAFGVFERALTTFLPLSPPAPFLLRRFLLCFCCLLCGWFGLARACFRG